MAELGESRPRDGYLCRCCSLTSRSDAQKKKVGPNSVVFLKGLQPGLDQKKIHATDLRDVVSARVLVRWLSQMMSTRADHTHHPSLPNANVWVIKMRRRQITMI
jgi:hypothetical protein